jgi:hypothetical protein
MYGHLQGNLTVASARPPAIFYPVPHGHAGQPNPPSVVGGLTNYYLRYGVLYYSTKLVISSTVPHLASHPCNLLLSDRWHPRQSNSLASHALLQAHGAGGQGERGLVLLALAFHTGQSRPARPLLLVVATLRLPRTPRCEMRGSLSWLCVPCAPLPSPFREITPRQQWKLLRLTTTSAPWATINKQVCRTSNSTNQIVRRHTS